MMLSLANIRERWSSFVGAFVAIALGVALITTTLLVYQSSSPKVPPRIAGAQVVAVAPTAVTTAGAAADLVPWDAGTADALARKLAAVPGVARAVVDRSFYAQAVIDGNPVADEGAEGAGHGWPSTALAPYQLVSGAGPTTVGEVAVGASLGVATGSTLRVLTGAGPRDVKVVGTVNGHGFYFSEAEAAAIAPGAVAVGLVLTPGATADAVQSAATAVVGTAGKVVSGEARSVLEPQYLSHTRWLGTQLIAAMAILGAFVTVFVVASTFALGAAQRRREIGLLRTIGAEPKQIRRMILGESVVIGALGAVAGGVLGVVMAPVMGWVLLKMGASSPDFTVEVSVGPILAAIVVGVVVALLGAWAASHRAAKVAPMDALRDSQVEKRPMTKGRWAFGGGALGLGIVLALATATASADNRVNMALLTAMALTVAAAMLAPVVIGPLVRLVTFPMRRMKGAGAMMVRAELLNATRRTASTAAPIIATVGFAVLLSGMVATMQKAYPAGETVKLRGLSVVVPDGTPGLTDAAVHQIGVGRSSLPTRVFVDRPEFGKTVLDGVGSADARYGIPGAVVLSKTMAGTLAIGEGTVLSVGFADGKTERLRVAAVLPDDPARGEFVLARDTVRTHDGSALTDTIFVPQQQAPRVVEAGAAVYDAESFALAKYEKENRLMEQFAMVLIVVAVGYTGIAVANTTAMAAQGRKTDFGVLKSAGGTVRDLLRIAGGETALVVAIGTLLGIAVTVPPLAAMANGLAESNAIPVSLQFEWPTVLLVVGSCLVLAVAASVLMTWRSVRDRAA